MTNTACEPHESLLQAHLDGELTDAERADLEAHLGGCDSCQEALEELQTLSGQLQTLFSAREQADVQVSVAGVPAAPASEEPTQLAEPAAAQPAEAQATGAVAGGYRVVAEIAKGGFGTVYKAVQLSMDRPVALKILAPHLAENEEFVARFLREARVAATITHPNLVTIFDVGQSGPRLYYSMELVEGEDVEALLLREGFVAPRRAAEIALGVARALVAAKQAGVVHRDIKPANVMVGRDGTIKLADLGLAKALEEPQDSTLTVRKKVIGSPNYMSPEQAKDLRQATHASDIYSLGATLLHMVSGQKPFGSGSPVEIIARALTDPIELPAMTPGGEKLPPALAQVIERAMDKDPEARFADAGELVQALEAFLSGAAAPAQNGSARARASGTGKVSKRSARAPGRRIKGSSGEIHTRRLADVQRMPQRDNTQWMLAAAAAVVMGIGLLIVLGRRSNVAPASPQPVANASPPAPRPRPSVRRVSDVQGSPSPKASSEHDPAELALAQLQDWIQANPDHPAGTYRRAKSLVDSYPKTEAAQKARALRDQAGEELKTAYAEVQTKARGLEDQDHWYEAKQLYLSFLDEQGSEVPGAVEAEVAIAALETQVEVKLEGDRDKLKALLEQGDLDQAQTLASAIGVYAGPDEEQRALARVDEHRQRNPGPQASPSPAEDPALAAARQLLAQVQALMDGKDYGGALAKLGELKRSLDALGAPGADLQAEVAKIEQVLADVSAGKPDAGAKPAAHTVEELITAYLRGEVVSVQGQRVSVRYDFGKEEQAQDFEALPGPPGKVSPLLYKWLIDNAKRASREPWTVHGGRLVGYGWTRAAFVARLQTSEPIQIEVTTRGGDNMLLGLGTSYEKATVFGLGFQLPELPISQLASDLPDGNDKNGYLKRLNRRINETRERGPSVVVLKEERGIMQFKELFAQAMRPTRKVTFTVDVTRSDDETCGVAMKVGRGELEPQEVDLDSNVSLFLTTLGASVAYDDLLITATLSDDFVQLLKDGAERAGGKLEDLRQGVADVLADRHKADRQREEEKRKKEEEKRKRKQDGKDGGQDGQGDAGKGDAGQGDGGKADGGRDPVDDLWSEWAKLSPAERQKRLRDLSDEDRKRLRERWDQWRKNNGGGGGD